MTEGMLILL